jgi:heavy metal sensor kinase
MKRWWQRRSLRLRLTVWYAITSSVILLALGGILLLVLYQRLISELDRQLRVDFETVESRVTRDSDGDLTWPGYGHAEDEDESGQPDAVSLWFEILSPEAQMLLREGPSADWHPVPVSTFDREEPRSFSAEAKAHFYVRVLERKTNVEGQSVLLRVFRPETDLRRAVGELAAVLGIGLPLAAVLSAAGGYLIANRSLAPVGQMAARAQHITAESLGGRLPVVNPHDELGRLATVFNATLARLEGSFSELRRFTADASHELRTPLTALQAVGEAALRPDSGDPRSLREALSSMLEETRRLSDLVDRLLLLARADTGAALPSLEEVDLEALVHEVREALLVLAEERGQLIEVKTDKVIVRADRELLRLALLNLVDNAIRYSPKGSSIRLIVRRTEKHAVVEVIDQGPGIAREHHQKIFERFYRIDKARSRASGGAGLGLSITRWAVERQRGRLELESETGQGSLFRIVIPDGESARF